MNEQAEKIIIPASSPDVARHGYAEEISIEEIQEALRDFMQRTIFLTNEVKNIHSSDLPPEEAEKTKAEYIELIKQHNIKTQELYRKLAEVVKKS